jgi:tetratricopeptide (TPR) repeat protein
LRLAGIALERLRWAEADQAFTDIDALWPEHPAGPWGRGMVAQARQQQERSCELLDESLRRDADFLPAVKARAALAARERDTATARHLYQRAVALAPSETALLLALADLDEGEGRLDDARRGLAAAWRLSGDRALARRLATLARRQGDLAEAQRWEGIAGMPAPAPDSETRPLSEAEGDPRGQP